MLPNTPLSIFIPLPVGNEDDQTGTVTIPGDPDDPNYDGSLCFNITVEEDMLKEGLEVFTLELESDDSYVCLGRDVALLDVAANEGIAN